MSTPRHPSRLSVYTSNGIYYPRELAESNGILYLINEDGSVTTLNKSAVTKITDGNGTAIGDVDPANGGTITIPNASSTKRGLVVFGTSAGKAAGTASAGTADSAARADHVHPVQTTVSGNAGTATKLANARTIGLSGVTSTAQSFDGSGNITIPITAVPASIVTGLATVATSGKYSDLSGTPSIPEASSTTPKIAGTAAVGTGTTWARADHVHPAQTTISGNAGSATKLANARTIGLSGVTATAQEFDGTGNITIPITAVPASIVTGLAVVATSGKYSDLSGTPTIPAASSTTPKAAGTAAVGTGTTWARADHVHPLQTTVSGNAGSATKLATAKSIGLSGVTATAQDFDGTDNIVIPITAVPASIVTGLATVATSGKYSDLSGTPSIPSAATAAPKAAGTAAVGTGTTWARADHVHPAQTTISGNAGSATKLANARTISLTGGATGTATSFDGSKDISIPVTAIDGALITGQIPLSAIPKGAQERLIPVTNDAARLALTSSNAQNGDVVKVEATGIMYYVVDDTKLGSEDAFSVFTAGAASSVAWSGITGKPTFATVATSGKYSDLSGIPSLATVATSGKYSDLSGIPSLATVATSGKYSDLSGVPSAATTSAAGLMSAADKTKLDGITAGANKYTHPTYTAKTSGLYKITVDGTGHVSGATAVAKEDITALGIPSTNTTYSVASADASGLMSAADKTKLDGIATGANKYTHPSYTSRASGLYKITVDATGHVSAVTVVAKADITALGIPGSDTTYSVASADANGLMSADDKTKLDGITAGANKYTHPSYTAKTSGLYKITVDGTGHVSGATAVAKADITALGIPGSDTTYSAATTSAAGLMSAADKTKLDGIATGATKITVDSALSDSSTNPVQNKVIYSALAGKANTSHGTHVTYSTATPNAAGSASAGSAATVSRSDHVHPLQTTVSGNAGSATKLATAKTIDGVSFDGSAAITHYGTCSTAAATVAKAVSLTNFTLATGARITIKFTVTNTASSPTLNVNSTGAKPIMYRGSAITAGYLAANRVYEFVYDGTNYELIGDINVNTTYSAMKGATASAAGTAGLVPAPAAGKQASFLRGDGTWAVPTGTTYNAATTSAAGLMSAADKTKLDGIATGANKYTHPAYTAKSSGLYKITVDSTGHVSATAAVAKADITALGIPGSDTTYSAATTSAAGLMSAADKTKLNYYPYAHYSTLSSTQSGYYKININSTTRWMLCFTIRLYQNYKATDIMVSGYRYENDGSGDWYNPKAVILGDSEKGSINVTFGRDTSTNNLWVAIPADNYTGLDIFNVTNGYHQIGSFENLFTITNVSSLTTIHSTVTAYAPYYRNETVANATTASSVAWSGVTGKPTFATVATSGKYSDLSGAPSAATTSAAGLMSAADKTKLDGIATGANAYTHPTTSGNKHIPSGGSSGQILRWSADGTAVWGADNNTTYSVATTSANGLMSSADKSKLDGIATGANKYTHPAYTARNSGLYKITVDSTGHVSGATAVAKADITALGIPGSDTTYTNFVKSGSGAAAGLVPAPSTTAGTTKYLREDGTWTAPPNTTYSAMKGATASAAGTAGLVPAPAAGKQASFLRGDGTWVVPTNTTYNAMTGATASAAGTTGLVPAPAAGKQTSFLRGDGTWVVPTNTTYTNFVKSGSGAAAGLVPAPSTTAGTTKYLREDGTWTAPPNTTYSAATTSAAGLMSAADKTKLDGIATGATKITVDTAMSSTSTNPVQNKVINTALAAKATTATYTVATTTSWSGSAAPYTQTLTVTGITANDNPIADLKPSNAHDMAIAELAEFDKIYRITTAANSITLYATEKTNRSFVIQLKCIR